MNLLRQLDLPHSTSCESTCKVLLHYMGLILLSTRKNAKHQEVYDPTRTAFCLIAHHVRVLPGAEEGHTLPGA